MSGQICGNFPSGAIYYDQGKTLAPNMVGLRGEINGLFATWEIRQEFRNDSGAPIEAGYAFGVPWKTELLGMKARIGSRGFKGQVIEKRDWREYGDERAVGSILRFDEIEYGTYGANLGVIDANETIVVDIYCAFFLEYEKASACLYIPVANFAPPGALEMTIILNGEMARGEIWSRGHAPVIEEVNEMRKIIKFSESPKRDFILRVKEKCGAGRALQGVSGEDWVMAASFATSERGREDLPLFLKILVDCSASMKGVIDEVRRGLLAAAELLKPEDRVSYSRFGAEIDHLWRTPRPCDAYNLERLAAAIEETDANMGGTNMEEATLSAISYVTRPESVDLAPALLLITDGQAGDMEAVIAAAKKSRHRIYAIGVGEFIDEGLLRGIAEKSGGFCKIVDARKDIAWAIAHTIKRIPKRVATEARVIWPEGPQWRTDIPYYLYAGESVHCFAGFGHLANGESRFKGVAELRYKMDNKEYGIAARLVETAESQDLVRFAYARYLGDCPNKEERQYLGSRFQILNEETALILAEENKFPEGEVDFGMVGATKAWNDGHFLGEKERGRRHALAHAGWLERQKDGKKKS